MSLPPPVRRSPAEEEVFQLSKELADEILRGVGSRFWKERAGEYASEEDFDSVTIVSEMKKKYSLLSEEQIAREVKRRIYIHHLR